MIAFYVFCIIVAIILCVCIVPFAQYLYARFVQHDSNPIHYYFFPELFDRHMIQDLGLESVNIINNREEMQHLWERELKYMLP